MSDKIKPDSWSRRAGRSLARALRGLLGKEQLGKVRDSIDVLKREYEAGRREGEEEPPRRIDHRAVDATSKELPPSA